MKVIFDLKDDLTVTNNTVKITCLITGVIGDDTKEQIDQRVLRTAKKLFPDADWAFSNYQALPDGFTFRVQAAARVDALENDRLDERTNDASEKNTTISIHSIDQSIPQRQMREEESNLRIRLIELANAEAAKLNGKVDEVSFSEFSGGGGHRFAYAATASVESAMPKGLGNSEKISLEAKVTVIV